MGANRMEIVRLANKHTLYAGQVDRRSPNPLDVVAMTTTNTTANQFAAVEAQSGYQDLYARVSVPEAARVGVGLGSTDDGGGWLVPANGSVLLPVRAGDIVEVADIA